MTNLDRCGYPEGRIHPHIEQCHRGEREWVLAQIEALADDPDRLRAFIAAIRREDER